MRCLAEIVVTLTAAAVAQVPGKATAPPETKHQVAGVASGRAEAPERQGKCGPFPVAQEAQSAAKSSKDEPRNLLISGRVTDGK